MSDKIEKMTDDDFKKIMRQLGMPESHSLDGFYSDNDTHIAWRAWQAAQSYCPSPDPVKLAELGWQMIECPICGGGAQAFPQQAAQSVPVVGEPVAWVNEYCIDEWEHSQKDNWSGARLTAKEVPGSTVPLFRKPTHSIPAAELATMREKAAEADELRKDAERLQFMLDETAILMYSVGIEKTLCRVEWPLTGYVQDAFYPSERAAIDTAIAQGKGE